MSNAQSPATLNMGTISAYVESVATSSNKQSVQLFSGNFPCRLLKVDRSGQKKGGFPVTAPKPSGTGLHLNSTGNSESINCNVNMHDTSFKGRSHTLVVIVRFYKSSRVTQIQ